MFMLNLIDQAFTLQLTVALLHFLWQGTLIAIAAAIGNLFLRRASANTRYAVHVAALLLMLACAAITFASISIDRHTSGPKQVSREEVQPATFPANPTAVDPRVAETAVDPSDSADAGDAAPIPSSTVEVQFTPASEIVNVEAASETDPVIAEEVPIKSDVPLHDTVLVRWAPYVTIVYFAGVLVLLSRLVRGAWDSRRLARRAAEIVEVELLECVRQQAERLGMQIAPALRRCAEISVPVVIGVLRPVILLPAAAETGLSMNQLQAIIAHELAHVRRFDLLVNLLQRVIETLLFFHPAVWWVSRQISNQREEACDELVLSAGFERTQYADALVHMAEISSAQRGRRLAAHATALAADGTDPTEFKRRILKVLGVRESSHIRPGRWALLLAATAALMAIVLPIVCIQLGQTATAESADPAEEADKTMVFLKNLKPDSKRGDPSAKGRKLAQADLAAGTQRILYFGKPWSAGKPLVDQETGYRVNVVTGCVVTREFVQLVNGYNETMRDHFRDAQADSSSTDHPKEIEVGMTFNEVIVATGKHYRPQPGMGEGQLFMVYEDVTVGIQDHRIGEGGGRVFRIDPTSPDIDQLLGNTPYADTESQNPPEKKAAERDNAFLKVLATNGSTARRYSVQYAQPGFPLVPLPSWTGERRKDGLVDLADLPDGVRWLVIEAGGRTVVTPPQPGDPRVNERTLLPGMSPRNDNLSVKVVVVKQDSGTEILRVAIENRTGAALEFSERDICLESGMPEGMPLWGLSPSWTSAAQDRFPITSIPGGQTGHLDVDWRRWVREGLWYRRGSAHVAIGPSLTNPSPDGISVRTWVGTHGSLPVEVLHPRILAKENPWPSTGMDTPQFKQRAAQIAADRRRLQGTWRLKSFLVKGSEDDLRDFPLRGVTSRDGELTNVRMEINRARATGVPNVIGRFRGRPAPEGPLLESREGTWLVNESHDLPTLDVTIPADPTTGAKSVRRQFLYRLTENGDRVTKLELACSPTGPAWAPASWSQTPLLIYTFESEPAAAVLPPDSKAKGVAEDSNSNGFSKTREVTLSMGTLQFLLDLDTGQTMDPPASSNRPELAKMDLHPNQNQGFEQPTALVARGGFLPGGKGTGLKGVKVRPADWAATVADVQLALNSDKAQRLTELTFDPKAPATWFFRTSDGTDGILQLTDRLRIEDAVNNPWGLKLRYKTITRDVSSPESREEAESNAPPKKDLPSVRLEGEEISVEGLRRFEAKAWGSVTLIEGPLNGEIAHALARAESIRTLRIFGGRIAGYISWLDVVPGVVELELGGTIIARDLRAVSEMTQLEHLKLPQEMTINVSGARSLAKLVKLKSLDLYRVDIDDASFAELTPLVHLEELDLTHTRVTDEGLKTLAHFPRLKELRLHRFPSWFIPEQLTDDSVSTIVQLRNLESLSISGKISDESLKRLAALPNLKRLNLLNTEITADGLAALKNSPIEHLSIAARLLGSDVQSRETIARHLRDCPKLKTVTFHGGGVFGKNEFESLQKLLPDVGLSFIGR